MPDLSLAARREMGKRIRSCKQAVAEKVTEEFLARHPDWLERYGERARRFGIEDACYHLDFLVGAIVGGEVDSFADYARWTSRVLRARGIEPHFVEENLRQIENELRQLFMEESRDCLRLFIAAGCAACARIEESSSVGAASDSPLALARRMFLQAILGGQRAAALTVAREAHKDGHDIRDLYVEIFQEALYEVGRLWETNRITVADEHMATAITQYVLAHMYELLPVVEQSRGRAVIVGVQDELHQVGGNMVADMLEADGWNVRFLGTNMPEDGILKTIREHHAGLLGISVTMLFNLPQVIRLVERVRNETGAAVPRFLLGGAAFRRLPELPSELRVDGVATELRQGVELARRLQG